MTKNNGQLGRIESHIGTVKQWTQRFSYDSIGRLKQSEEKRGDNSALTYKQNFDFDRFGNMYRKAASNPTAGQANPLPYTPIEDTHISKSSNRFTSATVYDDAGNVTTDTKFRNQNFGYDANGRMVATSRTDAEGVSSNAVYDASGQRVATEDSAFGWTFFIYDVFGKMVAEYGGAAGLDDGGIKYVLQDWQGSSRATFRGRGKTQRIRP